MGGLHSGRKRKHTCIDDCIVVDLAHLKKNKLLAPGHYHMQARKWKTTDFIKRKEHSYMFEMHVTAEQIALTYRTAVLETKQEHSHSHTIMLTSTPCNYGGARLWFIAPCCGSRVRVIYINPRRGDLEHMTPQCRTCLDVHYESQMSSYIERHRTYERHLLANYGLTWAAWRYDFELKEHYLKMTPELEMMRLQSQYDQQLEMLRLLIRTNRLFVSMHQRTIDSLKYDEDLILYTIHIFQEWGPGHIQQVIQQLRKPEKRKMVEQILTFLLATGEKSNTIIDFTTMVERKNQLEAELQALKAA